MRSCLDMLLEMGEERGLNKGLQALRQMLEGQLRWRFGDVPGHLHERIAAADTTTLQQWGLRVLDAPTIDAVFADG